MPVTNATILEYYLAAAPDYASSVNLARQHGLTRAAIYKRLQQLETQGFAFDGAPQQGYRITKEPIALHPDLLRAYLARRKIAIPLHYFPELDSTNSEARRQCTARRSSPIVVIAAKQTAGRGRMGRTWHSPDAGNGYLSFAFQPRLPLARMPIFTLWIGLQLCRILGEYTGLPLGIKWPNDLIIAGKKIAGILTEAHVDTNQIKELILGIGLNINGDCRQWSPSLASKAGYLAEFLGRDVLLNPLLATLIAGVLQAYQDFIQGVQVDRVLAKLWRAYDLLYGQEVQACYGKDIFRGIADGIDTSGALRLRLPDQSHILLHEGSVSLAV